MLHPQRVLFSSTFLLVCSLFCAQLLIAQEQSKTVTVVFKDGHQKTFSMAEVMHIDFNPASIVLKNGRHEDFSASDILRIEFGTESDKAMPLGRNHFVGKWRVGVGNGSHFFITLKSNGEAEKSMGESHGTWVVVDGEAHVSWDDGWHDIIRKVGEKHEKLAFQPGKSLSDQPNNVTDAKNLNEQPI